ncbi:hypothetical protein AAVH_16642 [Aphelenchoides avenae]|nr:hypothetical protein AAVH_31909 [Aphelenchus avenae]KAH7715973.1 hypothetical protein AAVH_16642 [Aphelenchus avenae]
MLPNESFLQVLHFADYKTLVVAKLSGRRFLRIATKYAEELVRHRRFRDTFHTTYISYSDVAVDERATRLRYDPINQPSLAAACRELDAVIGPYELEAVGGPHAVASLIFTGSTLNMEGVRAVFDDAPSLKYAENVQLYVPDGSTGNNHNPEVVLQNFAGMKTLRLSFEYDAFRQFSWTFLRNNSAHELRLFKVSGRGSAPTGSLDRSVEELVRYCAALPHLQCGEALELDFSGNLFSGAFGLHIVELLKGTAREVTFWMSTQHDGGELIRNELGARSDWSSDADHDITRHASDACGIVVEVKGSFSAAGYTPPCLVIIQRTAEIPRKKPRNE